MAKYEVAERLGISSATVRQHLRAAGVPISRHLTVVRKAPVDRERPPGTPAPLVVPPERAAVAFTADRGWHLVDAPPRWLLDKPAELE